MRQVEFHKRAIKALRKIPDDRAYQILNELDALAELPDPTTHPDVKMMKGDREGSWRLRVGTYRVVFRLIDKEDDEDDEDDEIFIIFVTLIGMRGDVY